ncbi:hypothetical protein VTI74DRAFT_3925 [Chaetomium olivicolor]
MFLHWHLSVGKDDGVKFFLEMAYWISDANPECPPASASQRLLHLYAMIDAKYQVATNQQFAKELIRCYFLDTDIFIPATDGKEAQWAQIHECLWDAPAGIVLKYPLLHLYGNVLGTPPDQMRCLAHLFQDLLSVPEASWKDITAELEHLKAKNYDNLDCIRDLYSYLDGLQIVAFAEELSQEFEDKGFIFAIKNGLSGWYKTSECLWSSTTEIRGRVTLNDDYEDLKDFFVDRLGVSTLTLQMVFDELLRTTPRTPVREVKHMLWAFNSLLQTEPVRPPSKRLLKARIFPVRCGDEAPVLESTRTDFALIDREHLAEKFRGKINVLDFTLEQVRQLQPFIEWAGLQPRYLSVAIKQITSRPPEGGRTRPISVPDRNLKWKAHALLRSVDDNEVVDDEDAVDSEAVQDDEAAHGEDAVDDDDALEDDHAVLQNPGTHGSITSPSNSGSMMPAASALRETPTADPGSDGLDYFSYSREPHPHTQMSSEDRHYRRLLDRVVTAARNATLPTRGAFEMDSLRNALPRDEIISFDGLDTMNRFRSSSQLERDKKIGAAGELYAFELLSGLDPALPAWSRANWQSTIRKYITVHPDYSDMEPWDSRETADIVYEDAESALTEWLIDCDYLDREHWQDARPWYYIEVKMTTGPSATPFYMSKRQFELMRTVHSDAEERSRVYLILRLYGLESERIDLRD